MCDNAAFWLTSCLSFAKPGALNQVHYKVPQLTCFQWGQRIKVWQNGKKIHR